MGGRGLLKCSCNVMIYHATPHFNYVKHKYDFFFYKIVTTLNIRLNKNKDG